MRLVTRSDFDGLVCAMILKELNIINEITFAHPKDVQDGKVELSDNDITTNLPYDKRVHLSFDHHESELKRISLRDKKDNLIIDASAKSAARVVYEYYGGKNNIKTVTEEIMLAVDKADNADFTIDDILNPTGWTLLSYIMDSRTGLGRFHNFTISNYQLMMKLIDLCMAYKIDDILNDSDVKERLDIYYSEQEKFVKQLESITEIYSTVALVDFRNQDIIHAGNRFMVYALYPNIEISIYVAPAKNKDYTALMIGKSILNKNSNIHIGDVCLDFGGGGHANAGTCQISNDKVEEEIPKIISYFIKNKK